MNAVISEVPGLSLQGQDQFLVKFFFTNPKHIPDGIPSVERKAEGIIAGTHKLQAMKAGQSDLAETGRVRNGMTDTGTMVYQNIEACHAGFIRRGLVNSGFALESLHHYVQRKEDRAPKFVVVLSFVRGANKLPLPRKVDEALRALAKSTWFGHVWDNSAVGNPATINFVGKQERQPLNALVVRGGRLEVVIASQSTIDEA